ncbi:hypothetical protein BDGGKGIB_03068 [Nodularia sphaerocarpa UHCC 0038]|nr:hypothetical protein BDGGKGIB_01083 [Nodularia sphaerocarpa UHCC 0038]ULP73415.1 hypothetical protein BDGGKGIB_03068 [Nodularia sphaerocarpa UHCC 0038]
MPPDFTCPTPPSTYTYISNQPNITIQKSIITHQNYYLKLYYSYSLLQPFSPLSIIIIKVYNKYK